MALCVLHLTGSPTSSEFSDLSLLYARGCLQALGEDARYDHRIAHLAPDGSWRLPRGLDDDQLATAPPQDAAAAISQIAALAPDVMVPHLFCGAGMTHCRALFDVLGIPYVGNGPAVMALAARKDLARMVVAGAGVAVPEAQLIAPGQRCTLEPPLVIKPAAADNSAGVVLVREPSACAEAVAAASQDGGGPVLAERFVEPGREVRCGVLEWGAKLRVLPLEEYPVDAKRPIRTAADKLARGDSGELSLVAKGPSRAWIVDPADPIVAPVGEAARRCHQALGCRHYSLFDFRIDPEGRPWFLEAGPYCSFSPQSVIATMAAAAGITLDELFNSAVALARKPRAEAGAIWASTAVSR